MPWGLLCGSAYTALSLSVLSKAQETNVPPLRKRAYLSIQGSVLPVVSTGDRILEEGGCCVPVVGGKERTWRKQPWHGPHPRWHLARVLTPNPSPVTITLSKQWLHPRHGSLHQHLGNAYQGSHTDLDAECRASTTSCLKSLCMGYKKVLGQYR